MSFNQFKLERSVLQSRGIFNKYIYETTDTIADVQAADYFAKSRFIDIDNDTTNGKGWEGGLIEASCSDGFISGSISGGTLTSIAGTGDISGPVSSTDDAIAVWDGTAGTTIKDSVVTVASDGELTFPSINNNTGKMNAPEIIQINSAQDLTDLATADVITVTGTLILELNAALIETEVRFVFDPINFPSSRPRLELRGATPLFALEYIGVSGVTFVSGSLGDFIVNDMGLVDRAGNVKLIDVNNGLTRFGNATVRRWDDLGDHRSGSFESTFTRFADYEQGFRINNAEQVLVVSPRTLFETDGAILFSVSGSLSDNRNIEILGVNGNFLDNSFLCRVDPALRETSRVNIAGCTLTGGELFDTSGIDGTFTAVADASITTPVTIDSITGAIGGLARFNFTPGPTLHLGQQVVNDGNSVGNYNRTIEITNVGAGFFESDSIFFSQAGTPGTFTSNSITLTDTSTVLNDLDTVFLDTDLSTDYDFGSTVYDQQTNSFRVNISEGKAFTSTATGSWSTRGLDQTSPKVLSSNNPNFMSSKSLAFGELNGNAVETVTQNGFYIDINVPTLSENGITERFKLVDVDAGIFEYTGKETYEKVGSAIIYAEKSGSTRPYRFSLSINGVLPDFATSPFAPFPIGSVNDHIPLIIPLSLEPGDTFQVVIAGDGFSDNITITDMFITD